MSGQEEVNIAEAFFDRPLRTGEIYIQESAGFNAPATFYNGDKLVAYSGIKEGISVLGGIEDGNFRGSKGQNHGLKRSLEDQQIFMTYQDVPSVEYSKADLDLDESGWEPIMGHYSLGDNPFDGPLLFESRNNNIQGQATEEIDVSLETISEIPVDRLLKQPEQKVNRPFFKPLENGGIFGSQGNSGTVWMLDLDAKNVPRGYHPPQSKEHFEWTKLGGGKYTEKFGLSEEEKRRFVNRNPLPDPMLNEINESLILVLRNLLKKNISREDFLYYLSKYNNIFCRSIDGLADNNRENNRVNKLIATRNANLEATRETQIAEIKQFEKEIAFHKRDKSKLDEIRNMNQTELEAYLKTIGSRDVFDSVSDLRTSEVILTKQVELKRKKNADLYKRIIELQKNADIQARRTRQSKVAREEGKPAITARTLGSVSSRQYMTENPTLNSKPRVYFGPDYEHENKVDLMHLDKRADETKHAIEHYAKVLPFTPGVTSRRITAGEEKAKPIIRDRNAKDYFKTVLEDFLEKDTMDAANLAYLSGRSPSPVIKTQLLNSPVRTQPGEVLQSSIRGKTNMFLINSPVADRTARY